MNGLIEMGRKDILFRLVMVNVFVFIIYGDLCYNISLYEGNPMVTDVFPHKGTVIQLCGRIADVLNERRWSMPQVRL